MNIKLVAFVVGLVLGVIYTAVSNAAPVGIRHNAGAAVHFSKAAKSQSADAEKSRKKKKHKLRAVDESF